MINLLILESNLKQLTETVTAIREDISKKFDFANNDGTLENQMKAVALGHFAKLMGAGVIDSLPEVEIQIHASGHYSLFAQESVLLKKFLGFGGYIYPVY